jgi:hypothetical protein
MKKPTYSRGKTAKDPNNPAARPPKLKGKVANDVWPNPVRSAVMPPPTVNTQEPRGKGLSKGRGKGLTRGVR